LRGGAGGLSYFSSGSVRDGLAVGASWPEAMQTKNSESRQVKTLAFNILEWIIIRNSLSERSHITDFGRQGKKEEAVQNNRIGSQDSLRRSIVQTD
jgi:hypothetical protein